MEIAFIFTIVVIFGLGCVLAIKEYEIRNLDSKPSGKKKRYMVRHSKPYSITSVSILGHAKIVLKDATNAFGMTYVANIDSTLASNISSMLDKNPNRVLYLIGYINPNTLDLEYVKKFGYGVVLDDSDEEVEVSLEKVQE